MLIVFGRARSRDVRGRASPASWAPHSGPKDEKDSERVNDMAQEMLSGGPLAGPFPGSNESDVRIVAPQTGAKSQTADRVLLDAFLSVRSRTRAPWWPSTSGQ